MAPSRHHRLVGLLAIATLSTYSPSWADQPPQLLADQQISGFDKAQVLPTADLQRYQQIFIQPVDVQLDEQWLRNHSHDISIKDQEKLCEQYGETLQKSLIKQFSNKERLRPATSVTEQTLVIKPRLQKLFINAPELSTPQTTDYYVNYAGTASIAFELMDGKSGELLATLEDAGRTRDRTGQPLIKTDRVRNLIDFRDLMDTWSKSLDRYLSAE